MQKGPDEKLLVDINKDKSSLITASGYGVKGSGGYI
jgi:hypothetical protein